MKKEEFSYTFQITKKVIFNVSYHTIGSNNSPHFGTSASVFNQPKTDFNRCGQCQEDVLSGIALKFFEKYDYLHCKDLGIEEYSSIIKDIEILKNTYNWIDCQDFYSQKELSKKELKKVVKHI